MALSVTGITEYGIPPGSSTPSGNVRTITIKNTGSADAVNFKISQLSGSLPAGTSLNASSCTSTIPVNGSCSINFTPGTTASTSGSGACSATPGSAPIPVVYTFSADNVPSNPVLSTSVQVLSYGCKYQGGYVYALDDTPAANLSVVGKVASTNQAPSGIYWSATSSGGPAVDTIYGIGIQSTPTNPLPVAPYITGQLKCLGESDGACNTHNIVVYYTQPTSSVAYSFYATGLCKRLSDYRSDWYLSAVCEMGPGGFGSCATSSAQQSIQSNLVSYNNLNLFSGTYWSSTEWVVSDNPTQYVIGYNLNSGGGFMIGGNNKVGLQGVLCSRALTQPG